MLQLANNNSLDVTRIDVVKNMCFESEYCKKQHHRRHHRAERASNAPCFLLIFDFCYFEFLDNAKYIISARDRL